MKIFIKLFLPVCFILLLPAIAWSSDLYVHSIKVSLYKDPTMASEEIISVPQGTKLTGIRENETWHYVQYKNYSGWVYKIMVKSKPPKNKKSIFGKIQSFFKNINTFSNKARRRPSSYTTTAAARGFKDKRQRFADKYNLDYEAVEALESIDISDEEALNFLMSGVANE